MDLLHLHLLLNHVPVVGTVGCVLLLAAALWTRSRDLSIAGLVALVVVALVAIPVYFTGEPAEERVETLSGVNETSIERHEDAALQALAAIEVAGTLALFALLAMRFRQSLVPASVSAAVFVALVATVLIARTASLGGEIRHTEIHGATAMGAAAEQADGDD